MFKDLWFFEVTGNQVEYLFIFPVFTNKSDEPCPLCASGC